MKDLTNTDKKILETMRSVSKKQEIQKANLELSDGQISYRLQKLKQRGVCFSPRKGVYHKLVSPIEPQSSEQTFIGGN